jgi:hypothetical protein
MFLSLLLVIITGINGQYCTYTQDQWLVLLQNGAQTTNETLCGQPLPALLNNDALGLLVPQNTNWLLALHQYSAAVLNKASMLAVSPQPQQIVPFRDSGILQALLLMGDTLERSCSNVSLWQFTPYAISSFELLRSFNQGRVSGSSINWACPSPYASNVTTLFAYQPADIIAAYDAQRNITLLSSLSSGEDGTRTLLLFVFLITLVALVLLGLHMLIQRSKRKALLLKPPSPSEPINFHQVEQLTSDGEVEMV